MANIIVQIFVDEAAGTYYLPSVRNSPAQGKLFSAYQNMKTDLRQVNLYKKRSKVRNIAGMSFNKVRKFVFHLILYLESDVNSCEPPIGMSEGLKYVFEETNDFNQIKNAWRITHSERLKLLKSLSISTYIMKFPAFGLSNGYELVFLFYLLEK